MLASGNLAVHGGVQATPDRPSELPKPQDLGRLASYRWVSQQEKLGLVWASPSSTTAPLSGWAEPYGNLVRYGQWPGPCGVSGYVPHLGAPNLPYPRFEGRSEAHEPGTRIGLGSCPRRRPDRPVRRRARGILALQGGEEVKRSDAADYDPEQGEPRGPQQIDQAFELFRTTEAGVTMFEKCPVCGGDYITHTKIEGSLRVTNTDSAPFCVYCGVHNPVLFWHDDSQVEEQDPL